MYVGGEIPVPHLPTILLVCCDHSTSDSSELSLPMAPHLGTHSSGNVCCHTSFVIVHSCHGQQRTNRGRTHAMNLVVLVSTTYAMNLVN